MKFVKYLLVLVVVSGCSTSMPPNLAPQDVARYKAVAISSQVATALGTLQHASIELNKIKVCDPAPCHPLLSDKNTGVVVDAVTDGLKTLRAAPLGWRATSVAALERVKSRLDASGKQLAGAYITAAEAIVNSFGGQ